MHEFCVTPPTMSNEEFIASTGRFHHSWLVKQVNMCKMNKNRLGIISFNLIDESIIVQLINLLVKWVKQIDLHYKNNWPRNRDICKSSGVAPVSFNWYQFWSPQSGVFFKNLAKVAERICYREKHDSWWWMNDDDVHTPYARWWWWILSTVFMYEHLCLAKI